MEKSDFDRFGFSVRNVYSAQNQFSVITQTERMVDRMGKSVEEMTGIAEERESSSAQIRTLFNEQRRTMDFQDAESVRSGNSHVTSQPMLFPKHLAFE